MVRSFIPWDRPRLNGKWQVDGGVAPFKGVKCWL